MSRSDAPKREIERHIIRSVRRLDDVALMKILEQLRNLATAATKEARNA